MWREHPAADGEKRQAALKTRLQRQSQGGHGRTGHLPEAAGGCRELRAGLLCHDETIVHTLQQARARQRI